MLGRGRAPTLMFTGESVLVSSGRALFIQRSKVFSRMISNCKYPLHTPVRSAVFVRSASQGEVFRVG